VKGSPLRREALPLILAETDLKKVNGIPRLSIPRNTRSVYLLIWKLISRLRIKSLTYNSNFAANLRITSSQRPLILMYAYLSSGVACRLIMINFPFLDTCFGMSAAGVTVSELPIAKHKSAFSAY
jgi:hypothetical protein